MLKKSRMNKKLKFVQFFLNKLELFGDFFFSDGGELSN